MSNTMIGFLAGLGIGAFIFSKMYRSTGGNTKNALIVAALAGVIVMFLLIILLGTFLKG